MSEIQRLPPVVNNPVHPNAKTTTQINNGTTTTKTNIAQPVCRNCKTQTTPLWRRDETGQVLCNACGLFLKLHGRPRPISLKTDTIKLRNRIKQPNFSKLLRPNTPELKLKDSKSKKLPKSAKKKDVYSVNTPPVHLPLQHARAPYPGFQMPYSLPHQVQLLHYPLLTPTQFAPGLQRITSPLLLSTPVLNTRASLTLVTSPKAQLAAAQAAGALETMSNELGPLATFTGAPPPLNGVLLMGKRTSSLLLTPALALRVLPALKDKVAALPLFGPQYHFDDDKPALPPLQGLHLPGKTVSNSNGPKSVVASLGVSTNASAAPSGAASGASTASSGMSGTSSGADSGSASDAPSGAASISSGSAAPGPAGGSGGSGGSAGASAPGDDDGNSNGYEVTLLKTRISELELVNDLYRTRIMELEALEQAARMREASMRKRLDEVLALQNLDASMYRVKRESDAADSVAKRVKGI